MSNLFIVLYLFSMVSFLFYGLLCLLTNKLDEEFIRYGFSRFQKLIGILELLGAIGLALGYFIPVLLKASALSLSLLMFAAVLVRIKIKDPLILWGPAVILFLTNFYLFLYF